MKSKGRAIYKLTSHFYGYFITNMAMMQSINMIKLYKFLRYHNNNLKPEAAIYTIDCNERHKNT